MKCKETKGVKAQNCAYLKETNEKEEVCNMPRNFSKYQYDTNPRKAVPDYTPPKKPKIPKKSTTIKSEIKKKEDRKSTPKFRPQTSRKQQVILVTYIIIGFIILFAISYRNSQIDENFAKVQSLKGELSEIEKQNAQLEISIENALNLNEIEQQAKELLGMQKLSNRQTVYVNLPKIDYIETVSETVVIEESVPVFQRIINGISNIFK